MPPCWLSSNESAQRVWDPSRPKGALSPPDLSITFEQFGPVLIEISVLALKKAHTRIVPVYQTFDRITCCLKHKITRAQRRSYAGLGLDAIHDRV